MTQQDRSYASGNWLVTEGKQDEFVARWTEFLGWTRANAPGLVHAFLIRDDGESRHFVSFALWSDAASRGVWKQQDGFAEHLGACRALCEEFAGSDFELAAEVS